MIERYVNDSPFNATERYLLVPMATRPSESSGDGFFSDVLRRYPIAIPELARAELELGDIIVVGQDGAWEPMYALAFAAIHKHSPEGWQEAPEALSKALGKLTVRIGGLDVATAGIPGTGFSGLKGNADPAAIRQVLEVYPREVSVYTRNESDDREPRTNKAPLGKLYVS